MLNKRAPAPFVQAADDWLAHGWHPFPAYHTKEKSKAPSVPAWKEDGEKKSTTGWDAVDVTPEYIAAWKKKYPRSHVGVRLPRHVLGIDVDMYENKTGASRLRDLVATYGPLPHTWISTSRTDGSGIYLFRVEDSSQFPSDLGGGVELIRWCHRFILAAPSTHPKTGNQYGFIRPDGTFVLDELFTPEDLPELPQAWRAGLGKEARQRRSVVLEASDARSWIAALPGGKAEPCSAMRSTFDKYTHELAAADIGSRHDTALVGVYAMIGDACEGHLGLWWCLVRFGHQLQAKRNGASEALDEFRRMVHDEVGHRMAEPVLEDDYCEYFSKRG